MKILIYGYYFLPILGGVQNSIQLLAQGIAGLNGEKSGYDLDPIEVTVVTATAANGMDDSALPYRVVRQPSLWQLVQLIRDFDVLHIAGPCLPPLAIAWLFRKPTIVEHHGYQANCSNGLLIHEPDRSVCPGYFMEGSYGECLRCCSRTMGAAHSVRSLLLTFLRRWLCNHIAGNIAISDHVGKRIKLQRTRTVYYGIEDSAPATNEVPISRYSVLQIASVGRLVAEKGLPLLLEAAKHLKEERLAFQLTFIGDGPERSRLEELTARFDLSDCVTFIGDLRGAALDHAVSKIAVVVMPSVCEETAGLSAIEQMMRGRLVIAADIGGLSEVVGDAGLKFAPGDSQTLASCLRRVIENPSLVSSLGSAARARAMKLFKRENMVERHVSIYREAILR